MLTKRPYPKQKHEDTEVVGDNTNNGEERGLLRACARAALGIGAENPQRAPGIVHGQGEDLQRIARPQATPIL